MDATEIHALVEKRECELKSWIKESLENNSAKLLAQLTNVIHDRDKDMLESISKVKQDLAVQSETIRNTKEEMRGYHFHNDTFKKETREQLGALRATGEQQKGAISLGKILWVVGSGVLGSAITVGLKFVN